MGEGSLKQKGGELKREGEGALFQSELEGNYLEQDEVYCVEGEKKGGGRIFYSIYYFQPPPNICWNH